MEATDAKLKFVEMIFFAIMVLVKVMKQMQSVNVIKRTELNNFMVKVVICRLHAMENHVKMVVHVVVRLKRMVLRSAS